MREENAIFHIFSSPPVPSFFLSLFSLLSFSSSFYFSPLDDCCHLRSLAVGGGRGGDPAIGGKEEASQRGKGGARRPERRKRAHRRPELEVKRGEIARVGTCSPSSLLLLK